MTAVVSFWTTLYMRLHYDPLSRLFNVGYKGWSIIAMSAVAIVSAVIFAFSTKAEDFPFTYPKKSSNFTVYASVLCGATMLLTVLMQFVRNGESGDSLAVLWNSADGGVTLNLLRIDIVLAIAGCVYFLSALFKDRVYPAAAVLTCVWLFFYLLRMYYDMTAPLNDPLRKMTVVGICSALLFLLAEIRTAVRKPSPGFYVFSGYIALFFCGISGFSKLILTLTGYLPFEIQSAYNFFEAAFALYTLSRMLRLTKKDAFFEIKTEEKASKTTAQEAHTDALPKEPDADRAEEESAEDKTETAVPFGEDESASDSAPDGAKEPDTPADSAPDGAKEPDAPADFDPEDRV